MKKDGITKEELLLELKALRKENASLKAICDKVIKKSNRTKKALDQIDNEKKYKSLFNNYHLVMFLIDPESGSIVDANPSACRYYGWKYEELKRMKISDIVTLSSAEINDEMNKIKNEGKDHFYVNHRLANGEIRDVEIYTGPIIIGNKSLLYSIVHDITDRKQIENRMNEALADALRFREALDNVSSYVYMKDTQSRYVYANRPTLDLFGTSAEDLIGCDDTLFFSIDIANQLREIDSRVFQGEQTSEEIDSKDSGGGRRVYWEVKTPIYVQPMNKTIWGLLGISIDITDRKRTEETLKESENRLARAEKLAKVGNWKLLLNSKQIVSSKGAQIIYGVYSDKLSFEYVQSISLPEYRNMLDKALADLITKEIPYNVEYKIHRPNDGKIVDIHSIADYDKENKIIFGMVQDITERKQAEEELREKDRKYKLIAENTADTIWMRDMNLRILYISPSVFRISGYTVEEAMNQNLTDVMTPESIEKVQNKYKELMALEANGTADPNAVHIIELEQICKDGSTMRGENKVSFLRDENNKPTAILGITRDITERKRAEEKITLKNEELQKLNSEKDKFFSIIAHDLQSPFQGLIGVSEIMAEENNHLSLAELSRLSKGLNDYARNVLKLIRNLLDWAQMQQGSMSFNPTKITLSELVSQNINLLITKIENKSLEIIFDSS